MATFKLRKSLMDYVEDNMLCAGRQTYFQRIVIVTKHAYGKMVKNFYVDYSTEVNRNAGDDKMSGLILIYKQHSVQMIEGSENVLGRYLTKLAAKADEIFEHSKVVMIYNNANQRLFNKIMWRMGEPITRTDARILTNLEKIASFFRTVYSLCKKINADDLDDNSTVSIVYLPSAYNYFLPTLAVLDTLFKMDSLMSIPDYKNKVFGVIPSDPSYEDLIWPIPSDLVHYKVLDEEKYRIKMTEAHEFGQT